MFSQPRYTFCNRFILLPPFDLVMGWTGRWPARRLDQQNKNKNRIYYTFVQTIGLDICKGGTHTTNLIPIVICDMRHVLDSKGYHDVITIGGLWCTYVRSANAVLIEDGGWIGCGRSPLAKVGGQPQPPVCTWPNVTCALTAIGYIIAVFGLALKYKYY
jgi:hypothetical protein